MKKVVFVLMLMLLTLATSPTQAKTERVGICHIKGNGEYVHIEVDDDGAYSGHINHEGDIFNVDFCPTPTATSTETSTTSTATNTATSTATEVIPSPTVVTDCFEEAQFVECPTPTNTTEASATATATPSQTPTNTEVPSTTPVTTATTVDGTPVRTPMICSRERPCLPPLVTSTPFVVDDGLPDTGSGVKVEAEINYNTLIGLIVMLLITTPLALWLKRRYN